jgi:hypothetical protein
MKIRLLVMGMLLMLLSSCAVKPEFLVEEHTTIRSTVITESQLLEQQRLWNWKNRQRIRLQMEMMRHRHPQMRIGRNTYNPNRRGIRRHIIRRKHNGVRIHKRNYWSKTDKHPQE